jgi:beta-lactamase superfamily II metal-dependent hydrolase
LLQLDGVSIVVDINGTKDELGATGKTSLEILRPFLPAENGTLRLDVLCVTHGDRDHCGGFAEFKEEIDKGSLIVGEIWHPNYDRTEREAVSALPKDYLALRTEILRRRRGGNSGYGDVEIPLTAWQDETAAFDAVRCPDGFAMKVLSPYRKDKGDEDWQVNDVSLVLNIQVYGLSILHPGDSSAKTWRERVIPYTLKKQGMTDWAKADCLIASHHGSYTFFGEDHEAVLNANPYPYNYDALHYVDPDVLLVLAKEHFPENDEKGGLPPHYAAYKWYRTWFRENRGESEDNDYAGRFKYTADGHIRLERGDDGWGFNDGWAPDDGGGGGKGFRWRPEPTRRGGDEYA